MEFLNNLKEAYITFDKLKNQSYYKKYQEPGRGITVEYWYILPLLLETKNVRADVVNIYTLNLSDVKVTSLARYEECDTSFPILVERNTNNIIDGRHRLCKLLDEGHTKVAVKYVTLGKPDIYTNTLCGEYYHTDNLDLLLSSVKNYCF